jgi:hypothetical protein
MSQTKFCAAMMFGVFASLAAVSASARPVFVQEPISSFASAFATAKNAPLNMARGWVFDSKHADPARYRAYRFVLPDTVMVGVARSVTLDANGHVHIDSEPQAPMVGHANPSHKEYSHILVPVSVTPP